MLPVLPPLTGMHGAISATARARCAAGGIGSQAGVVTVLKADGFVSRHTLQTVRQGCFCRSAESRHFQFGRSASLQVPGMSAIRAQTMRCDCSLRLAGIRNKEQLRRSNSSSEI